MKDPAELLVTAKHLQGVPIWGVLPGSAAARAGVRSGDIVVRVNGIATPTLGDFLNARDASGDRIEFDVLRGGARLQLSLSLRAKPSSV